MCPTSPPGDGTDFHLTIERLEEGEVSPFLHDVVEPGDELEVRGPIGGWFVWDGDSPALLVGGGSGVVPLMAMLRHARRTGRDKLVRLVVSVRSPDDLYYADELPGPETTVVYTRVAPEGAARPVGRLTVDDLGIIDGEATIYVCGSARFADGASTVLLDAGVPPSASATIRSTVRAPSEWTLCRCRSPRYQPAPRPRTKSGRTSYGICWSGEP